MEEEKEEDMERTQRAREGGESNGGSHQERGEANRPWESTEGGPSPLPRLEGACWEGEETRLASRMGGMEHT